MTGGVTLTLPGYDCVVNYSATCPGTQVACKWQVDSGSAHSTLVPNCENY
jgi:hypothetical protein